MKRLRSEKVKRGQMYFVDLDPVIGSEQGGTRPALVLQNDTGNEYAKTIIVAPITSQRKKPYMPTHVYLAPVSGLPHKSMVMLEQIRTVDASRLGDYVGRLDDRAMGQVNEALEISVGLKPVCQTEASREQSQGDEDVPDEMVLCLCPTCAAQFYNSPEHVIRRVDPTQRVKDTCTYCNVREGYDYRITHRKKRLGDDTY